ncbi:MAG: hypothetical protein ACLP59_31395 [Bryobacteraceae bacterium]
MSPSDIATQASQLADLFMQLSMALDKYRAAHATELTSDERHQLADNAQHLDDFSEQFTAEAIGATLAGIQANVNNIIKATKDAQKAIKTVAAIEKVVAITSAAVALGASIASGNPGTIASAAGALAESVAGNGKDTKAKS